VEACMCRLRDKIDKGSGTAKLIQTIRGMGYVIRQTP
jgi:DNA-binding response OmpR family regulator